MKKRTNKMMRTLQECDFNGENALRYVTSFTPYKTLEQAVASLAVFTHPDLVKHTQNKALFGIRRARGGEKRGTTVDGVMVCDNQSPTLAFLWANEIVEPPQPREVQFNHLYPLSQNPDYYTSLANIFITPAFLAKLTDTNQEIMNLLRYRAWEIYEFFPEIAKNQKKPFNQPTKPRGYGKLKWAPHPSKPCSKEALHQRIKARVDACPRSRIAYSVREFGWLLG
jgi:hypothetical protein